MLPHHSLQRNVFHGSTISDDGSSTSTLSLNTLASPRSVENSSALCKYKSGKCSNRRATKRNGQLHTLCHFHRVRQNEHQRKSDRKHRMVSVAKRAKLGSLGALLVTERRLGRRSSTSSLSSELTSESESAPASPMDHSSQAVATKHHRHSLPENYIDPYAFQQHAAMAASAQTATGSDHNSTGSSVPPPIHWRSNLSRMAMQGDAPSDRPVLPPVRIDLDASGMRSPSVGTPSGLLPPISFLTQQVPGKLDAYRSPNAAMLAFPPGGFLKGQSNLSSSQAGKTA